VPAVEQLRVLGEATAVVIGRTSKRFQRLVEVGIRLTSILERASFIVTGPALTFTLSLSTPGLVFTSVGPALCDEPTGETGGQGAEYAHASDDERRGPGEGPFSYQLVRA
jgi:hypothetical protein